jgi:hypothetical protein
VSASIYHFKKETNNSGNLTTRIEYNTVFNKTNQGGDKTCCASKWLIPNAVDPNVCPVRLFLKLMGKRSNNVKTDRFFLTSNKHWRLGSTTALYKNLPVGVNTIFFNTGITSFRRG